MYTITKGPSKLATQRRTGPTQQLDNQITEFKHKQTSWNLPALPAPKIVFNRPNGKKYHQPAQSLQVNSQSEDSCFTPAHEENVQFAHHGKETQCGFNTRNFFGPCHYCLPAPPYFVPIDLDEWWAQRFLANIDKLS
uniref:MAPK regulated corepressor interacting protein 2-like n=1 Tax=Gadus morhua TaxID=8049 RepID=A0A8C5FHW1_GADMO